MVLAGVALLVYAGRESRAPSYWEQADGVVLASEAKQSNGRRYAEIRFQYEAYGRKVLGRQLQFGPGSVDDIVSANPPGKGIAVRYDPAQPEHSLVVTSQRMNWRWGVSAVLIGCGVALALWGVRRRQ
jgi:hypothetical protein